MVSPDKQLSQIIEQYKRLVAEIDEAVAMLIAKRFAGRLQCRPGCSGCCREFSVLPLEAALISDYINTFVNVHIAKRAGESCNFLHRELCTIYEVRPIICRTQGIPLGYVDDLEGAIEVSACDLNFPADTPLEYDDLFLMDAFNLRLAELNSEYCRLCKRDPEQRISLNNLLQ